MRTSRLSTYSLWDITDEQDYVLLDSVADISRTSVSVQLETGKKKDYKVCVGVSEYWLIRQSDVVVHFLPSLQYDLVAAVHHDH